MTPVMYLDSTGQSAEWNWNAFWTGALMVATAIGAIAISLGTFGAATPLLMTVIAAVTLVAGVLTGINGVATLFEAGTGYNFVIDGAFQGNETAYNWYAGFAEGVAIAGTIALSVWQITGKIKGFTNHGLDRALGRNGVGVSANAMQNATRHPLQVITQTGGRVKYIGKSAVIVLNQTGKVITTWATSSSGWRHMFAIWFVYEYLRKS